MKRIFAVLLLLTLLCGCQGESVPAYEAPQTSATTEFAQPLTTHSENNLPLPNGNQMIRLRMNFFSETRYQYSNNDFLRRHDPELDRWMPLCLKQDCPHADETCLAWFGADDAQRYFAVRDTIVYCAEHNSDTALHFFARNFKTGERMSYHKVEKEDGKQINLADAAICGSTAILSYDIITEGENEKMHYILAFDLHSGTMVKVMERPILIGELYDIWGMTEDHIIVNYLHAGSNTSFFSSAHCDAWYAEDYDAFIRDQHRWVLLEYPITENAKWSEQLAEAVDITRLRLYNFSNFYNGTLYYTVNDTVQAYDLNTHSKTRGFYRDGITNMSCFDGKIFFRTEEDEFYYHDLQSQATVRFATGTDTVYFPFSESEDELFCYLIGENMTNKYDGVYYAISKEAFYAQDFSSAQCIQ